VIPRPGGSAENRSESGAPMEAADSDDGSRETAGGKLRAAAAELPKPKFGGASEADDPMESASAVRLEAPAADESYVPLRGEFGRAKPAPDDAKARRAEEPKLSPLERGRFGAGVPLQEHAPIFRDRGPLSKECARAQNEVRAAFAAREVADKLFHYRRALRLCPDDPIYHNGLGEVYRSLARWEDAEFEFREALRLDPAFRPASDNLRTLSANNKGGDA
jgi:tetratricopeptide (TPR) repeat protein